MIVGCPQCGSKGRLSEEYAGRKMRCPQCGAEFTPDKGSPVQGGVKWFYAEGREKRGPLTQDDFERLIGDGSISAGTLVWRKGMAGWQALAEVRSDQHPPAGIQERQSLTGARPRARGEKVLPGEVGLYYAGGGKRLGAKVIDLIFILTMASMVGGFSRKLFSEVEAPFDSTYISAGTMATSALLIIFYNSWFVGKFGATPGKMVFNLKIVTSTGGRAGYLQAFGRFCGEVVLGVGLALLAAIAALKLDQQMWLAVTAFLVALFLVYCPILFDSQSRGLHDRLVGTSVVVS